MRYYTHLSHWSIYGLVEEIMLNPGTAFANDFIFFVLKHCGHRWIPYKYKNDVRAAEVPSPKPKVHTIHALSYFSKSMQLAILYILQQAPENYEDLVNGEIPSDAEDQLARYADAIQRMCRGIFNGFESKDARLVLWGMAAIGRLTSIMYGRGVKDAPHIASAFILDVLITLEYLTGTDVFCFLELLARMTVDYFEEIASEE